MFEYYFTAIANPIALLVMFAGAVYAYKAKRSAATIGMLAGLVGEIVGYILRNYTPQPVSYTAEGNAIIYHTPLMNIGMYLSLFCVLLVAVSFFVFAKGLMHET